MSSRRHHKDKAGRAAAPLGAQRPAQRLLTAALALAVGLGLWCVGALHDVTAARAQGGAVVQTGPSGLPLPRFVSLKADRVNVRAGPGQDHRVAWTFTREGLPVEIIAEFDNWRRIRDSDGAEGWVFHALLSGRRTGVVAPWSQEETVALRRQGAEGAAPVALVEPGVLVDVQACDGQWCQLAVRSLSGWMRQELIWGVYPGEVIR